MLSPQEAQVVLEFLNRVSVQGLQEAANLAAVAQKVSLMAQWPIEDADLEKD